MVADQGVQAEVDRVLVPEDNPCNPVAHTAGTRLHWAVMHLDTVHKVRQAVRAQAYQDTADDSTHRRMPSGEIRPAGDRAPGRGNTRRPGGHRRILQLMSVSDKYACKTVETHVVPRSVVWIVVGPVLVLAILAHEIGDRRPYPCLYPCCQSAL